MPHAWPRRPRAPAPRGLAAAPGGARLWSPLCGRHPSGRQQPAPAADRPRCAWRRACVEAHASDCTLANCRRRQPAMMQRCQCPRIGAGARCVLRSTSTICCCPPRGMCGRVGRLASWPGRLRAHPRLLPCTGGPWGCTSMRALLARACPLGSAGCWGSTKALGRRRSAAACMLFAVPARQWLLPAAPGECQGVLDEALRCRTGCAFR